MTFTSKKRSWMMSDHTHDLMTSLGNKLLENPAMWPAMRDVAEAHIKILEEGRNSITVTRAYATYAANMVRLLVQLTGEYTDWWTGEYDPETDGPKDPKPPSGQEVLALYSRAGKLAKGGGWLEWLGSQPGWHFWRGEYTVPSYCTHEDGAKLTLFSTECGPVCPELPEITE
jgi:hypothetical protein